MKTTFHNFKAYEKTHRGIKFKVINYSYDTTAKWCIRFNDRDYASERFEDVEYRTKKRAIEEAESLINKKIN
jgi:hypothetical protein